MRLSGFGRRVVVTLLGALAVASASAEHVNVVLETGLGKVVLAIDVERAPLAANYFLNYVDTGQYNGATLYRSGSLDGKAPPQLVQGGLLAQAVNSPPPIDPANYGVTDLLPEWGSTDETGLRHLRGSVSLARDLLSTGHVIPEIVFCLRDIPRMDTGGNWRPDSKGFPVIGKVLSGLEVIEAVSQLERKGPTTIPFLQGQVLTTPLPISRAYRQQTLSRAAHH